MELRYLLLLHLSIVTFIHSAQVTIIGYAPQFQNQRFHVWKYKDFLSGSLIALLFVRTYTTWVVYTIGSLFLVGGIMAVYMINAPWWFDVIDLTLAYIPMAWLATKSKFAKTA